MRIIRSATQFSITAPSAERDIGEASPWLSALSDKTWQLLIDFRNWPAWIPNIRSVKQTDQESPARGTQLQLDLGGSNSRCSIDHWEPPNRLSFSLRLNNGEMAYGFSVRSHAERPELEVKLRLERSLNRFQALFSFMYLRQLQRLAAQTGRNMQQRINA